MPLLCGPEVHTNINDKGIPRESPIPRNVTYALYNIKSKNEPVIVSVNLDNNEMSMEVDTGAALSIISESTSDKYFSDYVLTNTNDPLSTYTGELINIKGYFDVNVSLSHMKSSYRLPLVVVGGTCPSLLGRNWLQYVRLDWHSFFRIQRSALGDVLARHSDVFKPEQEGKPLRSWA